MSPNPNHTFVIVLLSLLPKYKFTIDNISDVILKACDKEYHAAPTLMAPPSDSRSILQPGDLGPWGLFGSPPTEEERKFGVGSWTNVYPDKEQEIRYVFIAPENCAKKGEILLLGQEYSVAQNIK